MMARNGVMPAPAAMNQPGPSYLKLSNGSETSSFVPGFASARCWVTPSWLP